ncbi:MAG: ABC transporter permease [Sedimentibacter sp.]|uniref:ABC transporter permease n=1 Tax=Sedimentibacter sp. TaxID=1960295 RepID=UPI00315986C6
MKTINYIIKRIVIAVPVLVGVMLIIFLLLNVVPGDPITLMMKEHIKPELIERMREQMGLDDPVMVRFFRYMKDAVRGDFGVSYKLNRNVTSLILNAFPHTVRLSVFAALIAWIIGIPAGIVSAVKQNSFTDRFFMSFSLLGVSMPVFWAALMLQYVLAFRMKLLPVSGYETWKHLLMPAVVLGWSSAGTIARLTRSSLLEIMKNDFVRTARAKGLKENSVVVGHALKNAMLPVVTVMAIQVASLLSGAVITESVFGIPGIGRLAVNAIQNRDMPLLQGTVVFTTVLIIIGNLVADILYSVIDPRIRVE